ncbi:hypothetical protein BSL78_14470 [Apostichopus japonicus]|uniref:Ig-like domain-containing protein n=1 Tax=Stichopus japonicus TaxID=307972 RepID=A0A2G8KL30_STIJA|nr:hypothetical protein BSL78_14470 [Apostichopus japonicus]
MSNQDNEHRFGFGRDIGTLDIDEDGAMVINNVTVDHISLYTLIYTDRDGHDYQHEFIIIDCPDITVYAHHGSDALINCYFPQSQRVFWYDSTSRNARPIASLEGGRKAGSGVSAGKYDITNTGGLLTRNTTFSDEKTYRVIVIVSNIHTLTTDQEVVIYDIPAKPLRQIVVMVEDESKDYITTLLKPTYYKAYDDVRLVCTNENPLFILWKRNHETIAYYHEGKSDVLKPGYELDKDGSLLINKFSYKHEGEYVCIYNNGKVEEEQQHNIKTVVTPINPTPSIVGCSEPLDCTFNVTSSGYLTCLIEGVLPIVHPKWIHDEYISSRITFSRPQLIVRNVGSLFNIYLTTYYEITTDQVYESETGEDWHAYDVTASCSVNYEVLGQHKTDVTLHLQKRTSAVTEDRIRKRFGANNNWVCVIPVSVMAVIMIIVFASQNGKAKEGTCVNKNTSDAENNYKNNGEDNPAKTIEI